MYVIYIYNVQRVPFVSITLVECFTLLPSVCKSMTDNVR